MYYLPLISEHDFEAFRKVMGSHLANTYDEWFNLSTKWRHDEMLQPFIEIEINPDKFARFAVEKGCAPDINALSKFATYIGQNKTVAP